MSENNIVEMQAVVKGRVQGVFFRATTEEIATRLGIKGTVRNLPDGGVEIFAQGKREDVNRLMEFLEADSGPGDVQKVEKRFLRVLNSYSDFRIVH